MELPSDRSNQQFEGTNGWLPDEFDGLDHPFEPESGVTLNESEDLSTNSKYPNCWPAVYNQFRLGSCVANAVAAAYTFEANKYVATTGKAIVLDPSREFIYWNARTADTKGSQAVEDEGCRSRNALKSLHKFGVCAESLCPYPDSQQREDDDKDLYLQLNEALHTKSKDPEKGAVWERMQNKLEPISQAIWDSIHKLIHLEACIYPGKGVYPGAMLNRIAGYARLDMKTYERREEWRKQGHEADKEREGDELKTKCKQALSEGHPIVLAFRFYENEAFNYDKNVTDEKERVYTLKDLPGRHVIPDSKYGGHAVVAYGYDENGLKIQNSWGTAWNKGGTFLMPWAYITDYEATNDFWIIKGFRDVDNVDDEDVKDQQKQDKKT